MNQSPPSSVFPRFCRAVWLFSFFSISLVLGGCYYLQSPVVPIPSETALAQEGQRSSDLLVLLPGMGDYASAYRKRGFTDLLAQSGKAVDVVAVNAHFKYYQNKSFHERLKKDIINPAREAGYERIHLGGISLGGFGSLIFLRDQPELVDSVIAFAPYMGENAHHTDYLLAQENKTEITEESNLWPWLYAEVGKEESAVLSKIYLAYGSQDSFAQDNQRLAGFIPVNHALTIDGGHDWPTWMALWQLWLESGDLPF